MGEIADILLKAGRSGVELALFVLLPVMVVMLTIMRMLEAKDVLNRLVPAVYPLFRPFGLPGLGVFALIQSLLVSFAAPVATLAMMDRGGTSKRHIAATLALVLTLAQANVTFPMAAVGLNLIATIGISIIGGLAASAAAYHVFGRNLDDTEQGERTRLEHEEASGAHGWFQVIQRAGKEAWDISVGAIPMLVLALVVVGILRASGIMGVMEEALTPLFDLLAVDSAAVLPIVTKYIAGGTAMMGVAMDFLNEGVLSAEQFNRLAGFLVHPFDAAGIAIMLATGSRVAAVARPALLGALVGIIVRTSIHLLVF
jgi:spore maturation protein SpmB